MTVPFDPDCAFCRIASGDDAARVVYSDESAVAFLDRRPLFLGHTLVIPRRHYSTLAEIPPDDLLPYMLVVQLASVAMERALGAGGSFIAENNRVSQSVPHVHVHVVPRTKGDGLHGFFWPRGTYESDEQMAEYARKLRDAMG